MHDRQRLYFIGSITVVALLALIAAYAIGVARGRRLADLALAGTQAAGQARVVATFTHTPTPTLPATATPIPTPTNTFTPSPTATPTPPPANTAEWAQRFVDTALVGLTAIAGIDFTPERAQAALQYATQEQRLFWVPVSYQELAREPWAALVTPRTPDGLVLPVLFWRTGDNQIQSQLLATELAADGATPDYRALGDGLLQGRWQADSQGRGHILLIERPGEQPLLAAYVLSQPQLGAPFQVTWRSAQEPLWSIQAQGSEVSLLEQPDLALPVLEISSPLPPTGALRQQLKTVDRFIEQPPFAQQWALTRWAPALTDGAISGYRLERAALRASPLTALDQLLALTQQGDANDSTLYATRFDLLQELDELGLNRPARWLALYLDNANQPLLGNTITPRLRIFDNADRQRTFDLFFEQDDGGFYRLATISAAEPYQTDLITPAPPLPTATSTPRQSVAAATTTNRRITPAATVSSTVPISDLLAAATDSAGQSNLILVPTNTPTDTPTGTGTPTPTPTITPTPLPTNTPLPTDTPTPTNTATPTDTPTATNTPLPIPQIAPETVAPLTGVMFLQEPARLRGGPSTEAIVLASVDNAVPVDVFGVTETGEWLLVRVSQTMEGATGLLGWIFRDLVYIEGDLSVVPLYRVDGTSLTPQPPTPTSPPTETPTPGEPTATETPTPFLTPVISQPAVEPAAGSAAAPAPEAGEQLVTVGGEAIPAVPLQPIPVTLADGRTMTLQAENATVQLWAGLLAQPEAGWVAASAELLWAGAQAYIRAQPLADDPNSLVATTVRIVAAPALERSALLDYPQLPEALTSNTAMALIGSRSEPGVYLMARNGDVQQLWGAEDDAVWISGDETAGMLLHAPDLPSGLNSFSWVRTDGTGVQIFAQPFYRIRGVAGDIYGGLWWIETPQATLDQWQLWHYDASRGQIARRAQATGTLFSLSSRIVSPSLTPTLLMAQPELAGPDNAVVGVNLLVDSLDYATQALYTGVFRFSLRLTPDGRGEVPDPPQLLLAPEDYRGPLLISPDRGRLAYFYYDPEQPSLTSGSLRPANSVRLFTLEGRGANTFRPVYASENALEFLAPNFAWQGNDRLFLMRSRFAAGGALGLDRFGAVAVQLPPPGSQSAGEIQIQSYLLTEKQQLRDFAACRDGENVLLIIQDPDGNLQLARWDGVNAPEPMYALPDNLSRVFLCWQGRT